MNQSRRIDLLYIGGGALAFAASYLIVALLRMRLIEWYLVNCNRAPACATVSALIDYWWVPLIALTLVGAYLARQGYDASQSLSQKHS